MKRAEIMRLMNETLDEMGYGDDVTVPFGRITVEIQFENQSETLLVKEREMLKTHNNHKPIR